MLCEETLAWLALTRAPGLDAESLGSALTLAGSAAVLVSRDDGWRDRAGVCASVRDSLRHPAAAGAVECDWLRAPAHHLIPFTHSRYPTLLRTLADRPIALYAAGNLDALGEPPLAAVGSRNPTPQGAETAFEARAIAGAEGCRDRQRARRGSRHGSPPRRAGGPGRDGGGSRQRRGHRTAAIESRPRRVHPSRGTSAQRVPAGHAAAARQLSRVETASSCGPVPRGRWCQAALGSGSLITARAARDRGRAALRRARIDRSPSRAAAISSSSTAPGLSRRRMTY